MKPIFIALSPNIEKEDIKLVRKLLFAPAVWQRGAGIEELERVFKNYFQAKFAVSFLSGRTALWAILKSLGISKGDEVLLQAYTCVVLPNAVISLGAKPVWVDVDFETFNIDVDDFKRKITSKSRVVVVQHTFGQAAEIEKIIKIAKEHGLFVIEDCAQSLGGKYRSKKLGTFGDAAFFSFGRTKIISSVFGGMAITNSRKIGERLEMVQARLLFPSKIWILQQLFHPLIFAAIISSYFFFGFGKVLHFLLTKIHLLSKDVSLEARLGRMPRFLFRRLPNAFAILALKQFERLERFNRKRLEIAQFYSRELRGLGIELPKIKKNGGHIFLRYTIKIKEAADLICFAKKQKIFLGNWYYPVVAPGGVTFENIFYKIGSCPMAEKASEKSVNLPTYPKMTIEDAKRVTEVVKKFVQREAISKGGHDKQDGRQ